MERFSLGIHKHTCRSPLSKETSDIGFSRGGFWGEDLGPRANPWASLPVTDQFLQVSRTFRVIDHILWFRRFPRIGRAFKTSPCLCETVLTSKAPLMSLSKKDEGTVDYGDLSGQLSGKIKSRQQRQGSRDVLCPLDFRTICPGSS